MSSQRSHLQLSNNSFFMRQRLIDFKLVIYSDQSSINAGLMALVHLQSLNQQYNNIIIVIDLIEWERRWK